MSGRKKRTIGGSRQKQVKCRRGKKGSCSALKEVTDVLNKKPALASLERTHAHADTHTPAHTLCVTAEI